ncbi:MAG: YraN family protein [Gammaproteobacteria bacterium]
MALQLLSKSKQIGQAAEDAACRFLQEKGLRLVAKNYACKLGEIDLIMLDRQTLVFIEVRYRANQRYGSGAETVTLPKQHKLAKTAQFYLQYHATAKNSDCRFDVVALTQINPKPNIEWIKNAFQISHF